MDYDNDGWLNIMGFEEGFLSSGCNAGLVLWRHGTHWGCQEHRGMLPCSEIADGIVTVI